MSLIPRGERAKNLKMRENEIDVVVVVVDDGGKGRKKKKGESEIRKGKKPKE